MVVFLLCFDLPGPDTPGFKPDTLELTSGVFGLQLGVSGFLDANTSFYVHNMSYAFTLEF